MFMALANMNISFVSVKFFLEIIKQNNLNEKKNKQFAFLNKLRLDKVYSGKLII